MSMLIGNPDIHHSWVTRGIIKSSQCLHNVTYLEVWFCSYMLHGQTMMLFRCCRQSCLAIPFPFYADLWRNLVHDSRQHFMESVCPSYKSCASATDDDKNVLQMRESLGINHLYKSFVTFACTILWNAEGRKSASSTYQAFICKITSIFVSETMSANHTKYWNFFLGIPELWDLGIGMLQKSSVCPLFVH